MATQSSTRWLSACSGRSSVSIALTAPSAAGGQHAGNAVGVFGIEPSSGASPASMAASVGAPSVHSAVPLRSASCTGDGAAPRAAVLSLCAKAASQAPVGDAQVAVFLVFRCAEVQWLNIQLHAARARL
jgi:hypothetical protein